jgi:ABC-2 type transport system permease protein
VKDVETTATRTPSSSGGSASDIALAVVTLARRELVRFVRQRNRVFGALGQPIIFWLLFGAGFWGSFQSASSAGAMTGGTYLEYFFPGIVVMIELFTAIFATISIIEDRREGFLQGVLVAPIPRWSIVLGKVLGGTVLAAGQALIFVALAPTVGISLGVVKIVLLVALLLLVGFGLTSLGFALAWRMDSTQGFHAIMNVFLMPMWLLSGAFFPAEGVHPLLGWIIAINPVTYGIAALRRVLYSDLGGPIPTGASGLPSLGLSIGVTIAFSGLMFALAAAVASRTRSKGST